MANIQTYLEKRATFVKGMRREIWVLRMSVVKRTSTVGLSRLSTLHGRQCDKKKIAKCL